MATSDDLQRMLDAGQGMELTEEQEQELMELLEMEEQTKSRRRKRAAPPPATPEQAQTTKAKRGRPKSKNLPPTRLPLDAADTNGFNGAESEFSDIPPVGRQRKRKEEVDEDFQKPARKPTRLEKNLQNFYFSLGLMASWFNTTDGAIIASQAEDRAREVAQYASHHPEFRFWIQTMIEKSDLVVLIGGHATLASALMMNHGLLPRDVAGSIGAQIKERIRARAERNARKAAEAAAKVSGFPFKGYGPNPPTP